MVGEVAWSSRDREDKVVPCECAICWAIRSHSYDCPFLIAYQLSFAVMELPLRKRFQFCSCTLNFVSTYPCFSCCPFKGHCLPLLSQSKPVLFSWSGVLPSCIWPCTFGNVFQMWFGIYSFLNRRWKNSNSLIFGLVWTTEVSSARVRSAGSLHWADRAWFSSIRGSRGRECFTTGPPQFSFSPYSILILLLWICFASSHTTSCGPQEYQLGCKWYRS